jgi:hypothetical protein
VANAAVVVMDEVGATYPGTTASTLDVQMNKKSVPINGT